MLLWDAIGEAGESFFPLLLVLIDPEELIDKEMDVFCEDFSLEQFIEAAVMAEAATDEGIEGVHHLAADFGPRASQSDVSDLVLAAGTWAAAEMDANLARVPAGGFLELADEFHHTVFRLGDREIAKLDPGAAHAALAKVTGAIVETQRIQFRQEGGQIGFGDVHHQKVLLIRKAELVLAGRAIFRGQAGEFSERLVPDPPTGKAEADPVETGLLLRMNAEMISLLIPDFRKVFVRFQRKAQQRFNFLSHPLMPPIRHEKLEARIIPFQAVAVIPENDADGFDNRPHLVRV